MSDRPRTPEDRAYAKVQAARRNLEAAFELPCLGNPALNKIAESLSPVREAERLLRELAIRSARK